MPGEMGWSATEMAQAGAIGYAVGGRVCPPRQRSYLGARRTAPSTRITLPLR